jgi:hypothetical protein
MGTTVVLISGWRRGLSAARRRCRDGRRSREGRRPPRQFTGTFRFTLDALLRSRGHKIRLDRRPTEISRACVRRATLIAKLTGNFV